MPKWTHLNITGKTHGVIEKVIEQGKILPRNNLQTIEKIGCRGGGIGRRKGLKIPRG